jgi:hypothetical protein
MEFVDPTWLATVLGVVLIIGLSWLLARGIRSPRPTDRTPHPLRTPPD